MIYFVTSFSLRSLYSNEDDVLGHIMVLAQHEWPKWKSEVDRVMDRIKNKAVFSFKYFQHYVISEWIILHVDI